MNKKRILIIGGTGFIGSHLAEFLNKKKWDVTVTSLTKKKKFSNSEIKIIKLDLVDLKKTSDFIKKKTFEYVVNLSGYIDHSSFFQKKNTILESHFYGVLNLVKNINRKKLKKFIQIGSSDEYGNLNSPQRESKKEMPISLYSFSKLATANFFQMLYRTENFPVTILRIFLAYGPGQDQKRFIPQIITGCLQNKSFDTSEGKQLRDFCYIDDIISAIYKCLLNTKNNGEIFNVGSGKPIQIKFLINKIVSQLKSGKPAFGKIKYRKNENMSLFPDISKIKKNVGWKPKVDLSQGIKKTIEYYKKKINA